jgi:hypothetical protein
MQVVFCFEYVAREMRFVTCMLPTTTTEQQVFNFASIINGRSELDGIFLIKVIMPNSQPEMHGICNDVVGCHAEDFLHFATSTSFH